MIDISKLNNNLKLLQLEKTNTQWEYQKKIKEIDEQIEKEKDTLKRINELLAPYICERCNGSGEESYIDASGSKDYRKCSYCNGTGLKS